MGRPLNEFADCPTRQILALKSPCYKKGPYPQRQTSVAEGICHETERAG